MPSAHSFLLASFLFGFALLGAPLRAQTAPVITSQPAARSVVLPGGSVTLSATVEGGAQYQWRRNGVTLEGASNATLALTAVRRGREDGWYQLTATNPAGVTRSRLAWVIASVPSQVVAWGRSGSGQQQVPEGLTDAVAVAAGRDFLLALRAEGTVVAWGDNVQGQASVPAGLSGVVSIAAGATHSLALRSDGTVVGWGLNSSGQTTVPAGLTEVVAVGAGADFSVALKSDGSVVAWGVALFGQTTPPSTLSGGIGLAVGFHQVAVWNAAGALFTWGSVPAPSGLAGPVRAAALGVDHGVALGGDGTLRAWGDNLFGQTNVPSGLTGVVQLVGGYYHTLVVKADGTATGWGGIGFGEAAPPAQLPRVLQFAAGYGHSVALAQTSPDIRVQPAPQSVNAGASAAFAVTATGTAPLAYQWSRNGAAIAGATASTLTLPAARSADAGVYAVSVTNALGTVTSQATYLSVHETGPAAVQFLQDIDATLEPGVWHGFWLGRTDPDTHYIVKVTPDAAATASSPLEKQAVQAEYDGSNWNDVLRLMVPAAGVRTVVRARVFRVRKRSAEEGMIEDAAVSSFRSFETVLQPGVWHGYVLAATRSDCAYLVKITPAASSLYDSSIEKYTVQSEYNGSAWFDVLRIVSPAAQAPLPVHVQIFEVTRKSPEAPLPKPVALTLSRSFATVLEPGVWHGFVLAETARDRVYLPRITPMPVATTAAQLEKHTVQSEYNGTSWFDVLRMVSPSSHPALPVHVSVFTAAELPVISAQPQAVAVATGGNATLSVTATGSGALTYQWTRNGVALPGATNAALTIAGAQLRDAGRYQVAVANAAGSVLSAPVELRLTGRLWGVGSDSSGQLGLGGSRNRVTPVALGRGIKAVATNGSHSLFLRSDGVLLTVGFNGSGQLGNGSLASAGVPAPVASAVAAVAVGSNHSLWLKTDGSAWGMGSNGNGDSVSGLLGDGTTASRSLPVQVLSGVKGIAAGGQHSLFLKTDGTLWSTGVNSHGQLGDGTTTGRRTPGQIATAVAAVAAAGQSSYFIKTDGTLWAAGNNGFGQLGDGSTTNRPSPVQIASGVVAVSPGWQHLLFLKSDGSLWGAGRNASGQLGDGTTTDRLSPVQIATSVVAAAAGSGYSFFLKAEGSMWVIGSNAEGQLGIAEPENRLSPIQVATGVSKVAAGGSNGFFFKHDDSLWGMGTARWGSLGDGTEPMRPVPVELASLVESVDAGGFQSGDAHQLTLKAGGELWAAGQNSSGQLGDGTLVARHSPVRVAGGVAAYSAGGSHSLYVTAGGELWAMGANSNGQLGDGSLVARSAPVLVANGVAAASAGGNHSLFLRRDGSLWAMGHNLYGQLGDRSSTNRSLPVLVGERVVAAAAGGSHSVFLKSDGSLWTMGANHQGQLGDGTTTQRSTPVQVASAVAAASAGASHTVFVKTDGSLWAMGQNSSGQLGDGSTSSRALAVQIATGVVAASAADFHTLFLKDTGVLSGTGFNPFGQLGDGTAVDRVVPLPMASAVVGLSAGGPNSFFVQQIGVGELPRFSKQPAAGAFLAGESVLLDVATEGGGPADYRWRKDGVELPAVRGPRLYLPSFAAANAGVYTAVATNSGGSVESAMASLVLRISPPAIAAAPANVTIPTGERTQLRVTATGTGILAYQWYTGASGSTATPVAGATNPTFTTPTLAVTTSYWVRISDANGGVTNSPTVTVTVSATSPLTVTQQVLAAGYRGGETIAVTNTITYTGTAPSRIDWSTLLPAGWTYLGSGGSEGGARPAYKHADLIEWSWTTVPPSPIEFSYVVSVPAGTTGDQVIASLVTSQAAGTSYQTMAKPDPLVVRSASLHSADTNRDGRIGLLELTRVIELYNYRSGTTRTGQYKPQTGTEDGFTPGP